MHHLLWILLALPVISHGAYCPSVNADQPRHFTCIKTYKDHQCNGKASFRGAQYDVNMQRVVCLYHQGNDIYNNAGLMHSSTLEYKPGGRWIKHTEYQYLCDSKNPLDCPLEE